MPSFYIGLDLIALGLIQGTVYGLLAVGLVMVYRTSQVINFAHGQIGAIGAACLGLAVVEWYLPYWVALPAAVVIAAAVGGLTEVAVVRRLRRAPKMMSMVATLGVATFLLSIAAVINGRMSAGNSFPEPTGLPEFRLGFLLVTRAHSAMLIFGPALVVGLVLFLRYSRFGLALRAASANAERARLVGVSAARMSTLAWMIAGGLAGFTTILIIPTTSFANAEVLGPVLMLRALVPAVIARMTSMPTAMVAGLGVGVVDQVLIFNYPTSGVSDVMLLVVIVVALLLLAPKASRLVERESWAALQPWRPLPEAFARVWAIRNLGRCILFIGLLAAVLLGLRATNATAVTLTAIVAFSLMGLSVGILTGLAGQISLGQFAIAGVGAAGSYFVTSHTNNYILGVFAACLAAAAVSAVLGLPALRIRGLLLAVITLAFALAATRWMLAQPWALADGVNAGRPTIGPLSLELTSHYYLYSLVVLLIGLWLARNVWTGGIGLALRAQRDNEDAAKAFSMPVTRLKLQAFLLAGVLAGMGGAVYGHLMSRISADGFDVVTSINVVALAVLGGLGFMYGPLLGAVYIIGIPLFVPLDNAGLAATSLGWLLLILYFPGGLAQLVAAPRNYVIDWMARRAGLDPDAIRAGDAGDVAGSSAGAGFAPGRIRLTDRQRPAPDKPRGAVLEVDGLKKRFGGVVAVDDLSFWARHGEILGIIGPNGAGKTTMFELVSGFVRPDHGTVLLEGADVSAASVELRAARGLIRSFQDPALFATLTVTETVTLAFERAQPTSFLGSAIGLHSSERGKQEAARELVDFMGLDGFRAKQIRELSTGTRRITELACIVALRPRVLLLDEPSSGIAQRESEALGEVLLRLRDYLDATFLVIEHDIPLLMGLSDRVMAMDSGKLIAAGSPEQVRDNPLVVNSYLGGDLVAIERSGLRHSAASAEGMVTN